jgi:tetratricopeptide (TPR) repeat protein
VNRRSSLLRYQDVAGSAQALREAILLHNQGRLGEAERRYQFVLAANERNYEALYRLGLIRLQQARFGIAADLFRRAIKADQESADARQHLAVVLSAQTRHTQAIRFYNEALALRPDYAEAHNNLGHSLHALGRYAEAMAHYEKALAAKPDYAEARNNLGVLLQTLERPLEAAAHYEAALALRPHYVEARKNLGHVLGVLNRDEEALPHLEKALALRPDDMQARVMLGNAMLRRDRPEEAIAHFQKALSLNAADIDARNGLGSALHALGRSDEAIVQHRTVLAAAPNDIVAHSKLGDALLALGRLPEANAALAKAVGLSPRKAGFCWNLANSKRFTADDPNLAAIRALAKQLPSLNAEEQVDLHFALGKMLSDVGEHASSFAHLCKGNALMRRRVAYDEERALGRFGRMRRVFTAAMMSDKKGTGDPSDVPVFIIGLPRSGTTLIEQILASHPKVFGAGELRDMAALAEEISGDNGAVVPEAVPAMSGGRLCRLGGDYLRRIRRFSPHAERITDKMPGNFVLSGLIHLALPNARIIHACRDLRDTAFSCFSLLFSRGHVYSYDLAELGRYCRGYHALMAHWHKIMPGTILDVHYEDVVADLEGQARRIVAHCGLDWDPRCLDFQQTRRSVRTASAAQVRQPIYRSSIGRWRAHAEALQPLLQELALDDAGITGTVRPQSGN